MLYINKTMTFGRLIFLLVVSFSPMAPHGPDILRLATSEPKTIDVAEISIAEFIEHRRSTPVLNVKIKGVNQGEQNIKECRLFLFGGNKINNSSRESLPWLLNKQAPFSIQGRESKLPDTLCWINTDTSYLYGWVFACMALFILAFSSFQVSREH